jgi:hypothetical protein
VERRDIDLLERLAVGPSFLFLGQSWAAEAERHDLIERALRKAGDSEPEGRYRRLLGLNPAARGQFIDALTSESRTDEPPESLAEVATFPWNGVFTSAVDSLLIRVFDAEWRRVVPVVGRDVRRQPRRNPSELRLSLLFGGVGLPEGSLPPSDRPSLAIRRGEARELLGDLADGLLTPRGVLVIEGYGQDDWLDPEDLLSLVSRLLPGQVHLFSVGPALASNEFIRAGVTGGQLMTHPSSLAEFFEAAKENGRLAAPASQVDADARFIRIAGRVHPVPRDAWNRVVASARPVDLALLENLPTSSSAIRYERFRSFLDSSDGPALWTGLSSSFNFKRAFEEPLSKLVGDRLGGDEVPDPIIVAGQSGAGKSVALAALARRVALESQYAVLYLPRRPGRPQIAGVDEFALWAESVGAKGTLLVWDGMLDTDDYFGLARQLRGRGRKALIVGSTYRLTGLSRGAVDVPGRLDAEEARRAERWLGTFGITIAERDRHLVEDDASFLAALYRLLPETRQGIRRGLVLELRTAEETMQRRGETLEADGHENETILAAALRRAGLTTPLLAPAAESHQRGTEEERFSDRSTAERLTNMVVAAGQYDINVPLELVLRALGRDGAMAIIDLVKQLDIVRWYQDQGGEHMLGLRTALEGRILAEAEFTTSRIEWEAIAELLHALRPRPGYGGPEVQFAMDLMQRIGPQSQERDRYLPAYRQFVEALRGSRREAHSGHPRLLLIEANLGREYAKSSQGRSGGLGRAERLDMFREAEQAIETALDLDPPTQARLNLLTELASNLGSQLFEVVEEETSTPDSVLDLTLRALRRIQEARTLDPSNYYPVDVSAWIARKALEASNIGADDRVRILADVAALFESVDRELLTPRQAALFDSRSVTVADLLEDPAAAALHLAALEASEDPAAFYLTALRRSGIRDQGDPDYNRIKEAFDHLRSSPEAVRRDWRCARLTVDLFWMQMTGRRFLRGKAVPLTLSGQQWEETLRLATELSPYASFDRYRLDFLRALGLFHTGQFQQAETTFVSLDRATPNLAQRIQTSFVEADATGFVKVFTGQVQRLLGDQSRGWVWVDQLGVELPFIPRRFTQEALLAGDPLPEFVIEFNYRGPYAFPARVALARAEGRPGTHTR